MKTLFFLCLTLATCRLYAQDTTLLRHLPPDAVAIYHFNGNVLTFKLPWQDLADRIPLPQPNTHDRELAAILHDPAAAGIDIGRDIFLIEAPGPDSLRYISLLLKLYDSSRFSALLQQQDPGIHLRIDTLTNSCRAGQDRMGAAWNQELAVLTFARPRATATPVNYAARAIRHSRTLLRGFGDSLYHSSFSRLFFRDPGADIHAWTTPGKLPILLASLLSHGPSPIPHKLPGPSVLHTFHTLRFDTGRVVLTSYTPLPPGSDSGYARLIATPLPADLLSRIPEGDILGLLSVHVNPSAISAWLESWQARGRTEAFLFDKGISLETLSDAFRGDFLLTAVTPSHRSTPTFYFAAALRDPVAFRQWTGRWKWLAPPIATSEGGRGNTHTSIGRMIPSYIQHDSLLVIGPSPKKAAAWFRDSARRWINPSISSVAPATQDGTPANGSTQQDALTDPPSRHGLSIERLRRNPIYAWIDLKTLAQRLHRSDTTSVSEKTRTFLLLLDALDELTFTAGRLNNTGQVESTIELTLTDRSRNSLKSLFDLFQ